MTNLERYFIVAQTKNFQRTYQPIAVLAGASVTRQVELNQEDFKDKNISEQLEIAKKFILKHYQKYNGELAVFAKITSYICYLDTQIEISIDEILKIK